MNTQLDSFETRLLTELRDHVTERAATDASCEQQPRSAGRNRLVVVAACAAVIAAVLIVPGLGSSPAYSVGEGNAGEIHVKINRPEDAAGLEQALKAHGIAADITYLPALEVCAPGRYKVVERKLTGMGSTIGENQISVDLPPDAVRDGETFVMVWSVIPMTAQEIEDIDAELASNGDRGQVVDGFSSNVEFDVATGPVSPCRPVAPGQNPDRTG